MRRIVLIAAAFVAIAADCELTQPCDEYVDYMCSCHADDPGFDCAEFRAAFSGADPALQDQCAIDLAAQEEQDQADGLVCEFL